MLESVIPPTINVESQDPECPLDVVPAQKRARVTPKVANTDASAVALAFSSNSAPLLRAWPTFEM